MENNQKSLDVEMVKNWTIMTFRWTLGSKHLHPNFFRSVSFNYQKRLIKIRCYNNKTGDLKKWAEKIQTGELPEENFEFVTYDAFGNALEKVVFSGLKLLSHTSKYSYDVASPSFDTLIVKYADKTTLFIQETCQSN